MAQLLELTVQQPSAGVCVVTVNGELDMLTVPMLDACVRQQLAAAPAHLILDLEPVRFLASKGLNSLLQARALVQQTPGTQLHLAGLVTRVVARPMKVTGLLELFDTYPTLTDALAAQADLNRQPLHNRSPVASVGGCADTGNVAGEQQRGGANGGPGVAPYRTTQWAP